VSAHDRPPGWTLAMLVILSLFAWLILTDIVGHQMLTREATGRVQPYRIGSLAVATVAAAFWLIHGGRR
jgi:hypothetical protein